VERRRRGACHTASWGGAQETSRPARGEDVFRFDTFGNETFWTDTLRLLEVIAKAVDPRRPSPWA
jgi:hypothetical protein